VIRNDDDDKLLRGVADNVSSDFTLRTWHCSHMMSL